MAGYYVFDFFAATGLTGELEVSFASSLVVALASLLILLMLAPRLKGSTPLPELHCEEGDAKDSETIFVLVQ